MKEKWNVIVSVAVFVFLSFGAVCAKGKEKLTADSLLRRITYQTWSFPQEKIYIATDRDAYVSGDTIRFRAFLVDASTHMKPQQESKYIFVDLINPFGEKTERIKVIKKDDVFVGLLPLDAEMPEGSYTLCAYTQFMQNSGIDYFFRKSIPIFNQLSGRYRFDIQTKNGVLDATLYERGSDCAVKVENISINGPDEEYFASGIRKRDKYSMKISDKMRKAGNVIVRFDKYEKFVHIPDDTARISVTFHPEGGHLITNVKNRLAFKAIDYKGLSQDIVGHIIDETGKTVCDFKSGHKGMGMVEIVPEPDKSYTALIDCGTFTIPDIENDAISLTVSSIGTDSINIQVLGIRTEPLYLIAHTGGIVSLVSDMPENKLVLERRKLGSGIVQLLLVNDSGDIRSTRMIFNHSGYIYCDDADSLPDGDYSVSASINAKSDTTSSIVSSLLLQSELKGVIEDPDYYFRQRDSITDSNLDLLMLTHGWERYDLNSTLHNEFKKPELPMEIGGEISGTVKSRWKGKPLKSAVVMLISPKLNFADQTITDSEGRFVFKGLDWPDHTAFTIQVLGKNGSKEHNFSVDEEEDPQISHIPEIRELSDPDAMVDYDLLIAGTVMLEELVVTAPMGSEQARREMLAALGVKSFTSKEMEDRHITSYEEILRKIPGLRIVNGNVVSSFSRASSYNSGGIGTPVEYWVDGVIWTPSALASGSLGMSNSPELLNSPFSSEHSYSVSMNNTLKEFEGTYPIHIVKTIEYYRPSAAMMISQSAAHGGGALLVTTKEGNQSREWDADMFIRTFKPLGYQNQPEAYKPHYIYDPTSDDGAYRAAWWPKVTDAVSLSDVKDHYLKIEGIAKGYIPVLIRQNPQHQNVLP